MSTSLYLLVQPVRSNDPLTHIPSERSWQSSEGIHAGVYQWLKSVSIEPEGPNGTVGNIVDFNQPWVNQMARVSSLLQLTIFSLGVAFETNNPSYRTRAAIVELLSQALVRMAETEVCETTGLLMPKNYVDIRWS